MSESPSRPRTVNRDSAGLSLTPEQFDAIADFEEGWDFELDQGILVVSPSCTMQEAVENEYLGYLLEIYREQHVRGRSLDLTLAESIVKFPGSRRKLDRALWTGLGRRPIEGVDVPTLAVDFRVAGARRDEDAERGRRGEFFDLGVREFWVFDRAAGTLMVITRPEAVERVQILRELDEHQSPLLPGFRLPVGRIFDEARDFGPEAG